MDLGGLGGALGAGAGFLIGGPTGAAIGAGIGGGMDTNNANAASVEAANAFSAQQYATRWQTTVKDMEAAGLNPMLAYSQGVGNAPTGQPVKLDNPYSGVASTYASAANIDAQRAQMESQANLNNASAWQSQAQTEFIQNQSREVVQRLERDLPAKTSDQLVALAEQLRSQAELNGTSALRNESEIILNKRIAEKVLSEKVLNDKLASLKQLDLNAAANFGNAGRNMGELQPFLKMVIDVIRMMK